jgi:Calcineurin-like phosphoesterase
MQKSSGLTNVVVAPGSEAHRRAPAPTPPSSSLAPGFQPQPGWNLVNNGGPTIADLTFVNRYVGGAVNWQASDMTSIDNALSKAMSDAGLQSVISQYYPGPITSTMLPSAVHDAAVAATVAQADVEALATQLHGDGVLGAADPAKSVINIMLPAGVILSDGQNDSTQGLGGYHGSAKTADGTEVYYAVGVYSQTNADGSVNGIDAFGTPWKNVVATFYHELNEARTDTAVEDSDATGDNSLLGWYSQAGGGEIGDLPINLVNQLAGPLSMVFQEVPLADGSGTVPVQLMWSNADAGPAARSGMVQTASMGGGAPAGGGTTTPWTGNLAGQNGALFGDPTPSPDETAFQVDNTSDAYYKSPYYAAHATDVLAVPTGPPAKPMALTDVVGNELLAPIIAGNKIAFHCVGDTGASLASKIATEASVADAMTGDLKGATPDVPAFFYHLGDVIYNFGEAQYYYDQFYEPFRDYDRPIFAIPGNHDGAVTYINDPSTPDYPSLSSFRANFCTDSPTKPASIGGLARTTMTQPGVYFTLDAPFVSIIGLYTNVLEGPGVITDQNGHYRNLVGDGQYDWLVSELKRLAPERQAVNRAVIVACHHPPASADTVHGGATGLSQDLDRAFTEAGLWPDVILSGHAHIYQRFSRTVAAAGGVQLPYIVAGSGGHNDRPAQGSATAPASWGEFDLVVGPVSHYGYLTVTVDMRDPSAKTLTIAFTAPADSSAGDSLTVSLK